MIANSRARALKAMPPRWQLRRLPVLLLRLLLNFFRSLWQMRPVLGLVLVVAIAVPWFVWAGMRTGGQGPIEFLVKWNLRPFTQSIQGHTGPIWYHVVGVLLLFFPWSVFMGPTLADAVRQGRRDAARRPVYVLLACWLGVWMVFWSLCQTKLPHYILPAYPALALADRLVPPRLACRARPGEALGNADRHVDHAVGRPGVRGRGADRRPDSRPRRRSSWRWSGCRWCSAARPGCGVCGGPCASGCLGSSPWGPSRFWSPCSASAPQGSTATRTPGR